MTNAEHLRVYRARAVAEGKCTMCRKHTPKEGCVSCPPCLDRIAAYKERRSDLGLCRCGSSSRIGRMTCSQCAAIDGARNKARREDRARAGICARCRSVAREGRVTCLAHARSR